MPRLAANLDWLFTELPFLDRFEAAARAGFKGVEILGPYAYPCESVGQALHETGLKLVLINAAPYDWTAGERGLAALPGRERDFTDGIDRAAIYARALNCPRVHVLAGMPPPNSDPAECRALYRRNLALAARRLNALGVMMLIEPLNPRDAPGYFLTRQDEALAHLAAVAAPNARLQMDLYHCQIVEGDLAARLRANIDRIGHVQLAGVPERDEPDHGEVHYPYLLGLLDELGYQGWVGCEYRPRETTLAGLGWARPYGIGG